MRKWAGRAGKFYQVGVEQHGFGGVEKHILLFNLSFQLEQGDDGQSRDVFDLFYNGAGLPGGGRMVRSARCVT